MNEAHPRDRFITVYGRKPVLEALRDARLPVDKLLVARNATGPVVDDILAAARARGVRPERVTPREVTRLSRNGRQDQGVVADVRAPRMQALSAWLAEPPEAANVLLLDGLTNPANVGMILRAATAAGLDGVLLPRRGSPEVGPLVIKASAGVAFHAPILRCADAAEAASALTAAGFELIGLRGERAASLYEASLPARAAFVLGNETEGQSEALTRAVRRWLCIPMAAGVESLNVATAAAVLAFEVRRRQLGQSKSAPTGT